MSYEDLKNKVVIVTGSSSGIGEAIAIQMSKNGCQVVINARNKDNLQRVAMRCEESSPSMNKPMIYVGDLNKEDDVKKLVSQTIEMYGRIDVLVNNAGCVLLSDISDGDFMEKYDYTMNVNTRSAVLLCHLCLPNLIESKGCIINVCSVTSNRHDFDGGLSYAMSKGAMDSLTKYLSCEVAPKGVRVNAVLPGWIRSTIHKQLGLPESAYDEFAKTYPMRRPGESEEVANLVCFLASKAASYITGESIVIDGGYQIM